jgi:replicative DNA helicase
MSYRTGHVLYDQWWDELMSGTAAPTWSSCDPIFRNVEIGPGRIALLAGPPGAGKTSLIGQWTTDLLVGNPRLRCLIANVEMAPSALLTRQLARLSGVPLTAILRREFSTDELRELERAAAQIRDLLDRLAFAEEPHRLEAIARAGSDFEADVVIIDYVQRIEPSGKASGLRERMNVLMSEMRRLADKGRIGIIAAAAVSRTRDNSGRASYAGQHLGLASLRESGELEFGADDVLLLAATDEDTNALVRSMLLKHEKARYGEPRDVALSFDRRIQCFEIDPWITTAPCEATSNTHAIKVSANTERKRWEGGRS